MSDMKQYFGLYYYFGFVLNVESQDGDLIASMPGVPAGYEILLEPVGGDQFRNIGGPIDGATLKFMRDEFGIISGMTAGTFELTKINPSDLKTLPVIERYPGPNFLPSPEKQAQFKELLQAALKRADGAWIDYHLPYPKHEFIQFVTGQDIIIFHGSNNMEIDEFQPIRKSMELFDETGRGNLQGVYGTHDGLWSMFFAVVNRKQLKGSIRNGVMYFRNREGEQIAVYNFSINQEQLKERPYNEGALYFLPRDTFTRLQLIPDTYANEWASELPVKPIAKLKLQPDDFPFLEQIGGHDDGIFIRLNNMAAQIREAALSAKIDGDRFEVIISRQPESTFSVQEYVELQRIMMPAAQFKVQTYADEVHLTITSVPPAVRQMLADKYQDLLIP